MGGYIRSAFWVLAVLGNLVAAWLLYLGVVSIFTAAADGGAGALGASFGSAITLGYGLAFSIVPTCLALAVDRATRE